MLHLKSLAVHPNRFDFQGSHLRLEHCQRLELGAVHLTELARGEIRLVLLGLLGISGLRRALLVRVAVG